jgi:hypothetical protein
MCDIFFVWFSPLFLEGNHLTKSNTFSRYCLETEIMWLVWSADLGDIFFMWISSLFFKGSTIDQNVVTWTTSTVFKTMTSNFIYMFGMKRRCARHIFMWITTLFFSGEHDFTKSSDANYFYSFEDIDLKL